MGPLDVQSNYRPKERMFDYKSLRKALCIGYGNQLAERKIHHNGYRTLETKMNTAPQTACALFDREYVHPSSVLEMDEDGNMPNYIVYHELIATTRPFLRNVCAVEMSWVMPILRKLEKLDIHKLSGGSTDFGDDQAGKDRQLGLPTKEDSVINAPNSHESKIQAARERFLARKLNK
ncbi:hypothetical protein ACLOJK_009132 [Asimina triloba]